MENDLRQAIDVLRKGGIILYPTDTIWGIGCDASDSEAVKRIYALKKRTDAKAMLSLVGSETQLERSVSKIPDVAWELIDAAIHPLTIIYSNPVGLAHELLAPDGSAGIRLTRERFSAELCRRLGHPVVSTSANVSGKAAPASFNTISQDIINGVDYVVNYRRDEIMSSRPSDIIRLGDGGLFTIIRGRR